MSNNLVILPGLPGTPGLYQPILPYLSEYDTQIITYPEEGDQGFPALAEYITSIIKFDQFHVVGESYGGPIALKLAELMPDKVKSAVLTTSFISKPVPEFVKFLPLKFFIGLGVPKGAFRKFLVGGASEETVAEVQKIALAVSPGTLAARLKKMACLGDDFAPSVSCRILYVRGMQDLLVDKRFCDEIQKQYPSAEIIEMDGPHLLFMTKPEALSKILINFFQRETKE